MTAAPGTGPGAAFLPLLRQNLTKLVATNSLQAFYPPQRIEEVLARLEQVDFRYCNGPHLMLILVCSRTV